MVEEVLLNEVVVRFRPGVETQRLAAVPDLTVERRAVVVAGVKRCSLFTHDEAPAAERAGQRMGDDLEALASFVDGIRQPTELSGSSNRLIRRVASRYETGRRVQRR